MKQRHPASGNVPQTVGEGEARLGAGPGDSANFRCISSLVCPFFRGVRRFPLGGIAHRAVYFAAVFHPINRPPNTTNPDINRLNLPPAHLFQQLIGDLRHDVVVEGAHSFVALLADITFGVRFGIAIVLLLPRSPRNAVESVVSGIADHALEGEGYPGFGVGDEGGGGNFVFPDCLLSLRV